MIQEKVRKKRLELPDDAKEFIMANYQSMSVPDMAKKMKRGSTTVYGWMKDLQLKPKGLTITNDHPFKKSNRNLEAFLTSCRNDRIK